MSTAKTGLNWSRTLERYVTRSLPLCPMLATVMSTAREKTTEGIPIWSLVIIWIISLYNMVSSRYVRQTEEEMERLLSEKDSKNTKRAISTSVKCFRNYLQANGIDQEFESFNGLMLRCETYY